MTAPRLRQKVCLITGAAQGIVEVSDGMSL